MVDAVIDKKACAGTHASRPWPPMRVAFEPAEPLLSVLATGYGAGFKILGMDRKRRAGGPVPEVRGRFPVAARSQPKSQIY